MAESNFLDAAPAKVQSGIAPDALAPHGEPCPSCGCPTEASDKFCPACGTPNAQTTSAVHPRNEPVEAEAVDAPPAQAGVDRAPFTPPLKHFRCSACGSEMAADPNQRSYVCPFCDSTYVVEFTPEASNRQPPEFVIGFAVTREQAQEKFREWLRDNSWFRPGDLTSKAVADKQRGVYLPFWSFATLGESSWSAQIGEHWYRTVTYTTRDSSGKTVTRTRQVQETEWWPLSGAYHEYYTGYLVSGSRGLPQQDAEQIMPFNLPALKRYEPYFLAGWLCEEYSVDRETALQMSLQEFERRAQQHVARFLPGDTQRSVQVATRFSQASSDLCLLPIYILSYRYHDKLFRFLINGQTGKFAGQKPVSWSRILFAIGGIAALIALIALIVALMQR